MAPARRSTDRGAGRIGGLEGEGTLNRNPGPQRIEHHAVALCVLQEPPCPFRAPIVFDRDTRLAADLLEPNWCLAVNAEGAAPIASTSKDSSSMLIAAATMRKVISWQAASAPRSRSPEHGTSPTPPTPGCAPELHITSGTASGLIAQCNGSARSLS
jgi:hypothetical protein